MIANVRVIKKSDALTERVDAMKATVAASLPHLRTLSLEDFGKLLLSLPNPSLPHLSEILPTMAPDETQLMWTGSSGASLMSQSRNFMQWMAKEFESQTGREFRNVNALDFGCGWGRLMRMQLYYNDPQYIFGCDAWEGSLKHSRDHNVLGELRKSDIVPERLPFDDASMDCIYAYSIFTHTSERATKGCLAAIRKVLKPDGVAFVTARHKDFWKYIGARRDVGDIAALEAAHARDEFVHVTGPAAEYGESSFSIDYLRREFPEWEIVGETILTMDDQQQYVVLKPR